MASANQTVIDTVGPTITDASGNVWTITSGGQVALNGTTQTTTSSVTKMAIVNSVIWAENSSSNWYSSPGGTGYWTGPAASPLVASPTNTVVNTVGPTIVDAGGNSWTITSSAQMAVDSVAVAVTSNVIELAYVNGVVWQLNTSNDWYSVTSVTLPSTVVFSGATTVSPIGGLTIVTPGQQISNAGFTVTGTIVGYSAAPTLYYRDDSGTWGPLPGGAVVSATAFSFTNPALTAGTHTVSVEDSNNTAIAVSSGSFTVVAATTPVITVTAPSLPATGDPFTLFGTLANYAATPTLTYSDNGSTPASLPSGAVVTTTSFTFTHPGLAAGPYTTIISDGTNPGEVSYSVTAIAGGASPNLATAPPNTFLTDGSNNRWTIAANARVAVNGVVDTTSSNAVELAWVTATMWYKNSSGLWFGKATPTGTWAPAAGTTVSPLTNLPTLAINPIANPSPNTTFPVTGSLANYATVPTLTYSDNGGTAHALPTGSTVSATAFSFTHPGMVSGSDTLTVSDGTYTSPAASYSVYTPGFISLSPTTSQAITITGLLPATPYTVQVYATNSGGQGPASSQVSATTNATTQTLPSAPTGLTSTLVAQTSVTLSWTAPSTGTAPFTYATQWSLHGANTWTAGPSGSTTTAQITGLTASTSYDFQVDAANGAGTGPESSIYTVSTSASTAAVTWSTTAYFGTLTWSNANLTVTVGGSTTPNAQHACVLSTTAVSSGNVSFEVTLTDVTVNSSIGLVNSSYLLTNALGSDVNSTGFFMAHGANPAQTIYYNGTTSLAQPSGNAPGSDANGAIFTFCVNFTSQVWWVTGPAMQTAYGSAAWNDSATASPATGVGGIPIGVTGGLSIAFSAGEGGGVAVLNPGSSTFYRASEIPSTFPAWNGTAITVIIPGQVTGLTAGTPTTSSVGLTWTAPTTGSLPFTYYVMQSPHGANSWTTVGSSATTAFTVTGLTSSTSYDFEVYAANSAGDGTASALVTITTATSITVPGAPVGLSPGTPTSTTVPLTWQPPTTGSTPTGYQVQYKLSTASTWTNFPTTVPE